MGLFSKKEKKEPIKKGIDKELTEEELDEVKAGVSHVNRDCCPRVKVEPIHTGELTEKELDEVTAGVPIIDEGR